MEQYENTLSSCIRLFWKWNVSILDIVDTRKSSSYKRYNVWTLNWKQGFLLKNVKDDWKKITNTNRKQNIDK